MGAIVEAVTGVTMAASVEELKEKARTIRKNIIRMTHKAGSGHTGGSLGMADIFTALYFSVLLHKKDNPEWEGRDRFILSNGHICPVWYATLAEAGYIPKEDLLTLRQLGSKLQGHPANIDLPIVELSTGSLGQGVCAAVGLAIGYKLDKKKNTIYVGLGDGEMQEGSVWEALMAAAHYKLNNLIAFVDRNWQQQGGRTKEMIGLEPLKAKLEAFNWTVYEADGHDFGEILGAFKKAKDNSKGPSIILFTTVMGKGVSFMENDFGWHGKAPDDKQEKQALKELGGE